MIEPRGHVDVEVGLAHAERLGYAAADLDSIPAAAIDSVAGVGHDVDLAELRSGESVVDLGSGADALDRAILGALTRLLVVTGPRVPQLQAAFCAVPLLRDAPCEAALVTVGAPDEDAQRIAARLPWRHAAAVPADPSHPAGSTPPRAPCPQAVDRTTHDAT